MTLRLVTDGDSEPPGTAVEILPDSSPAIPAGRPLHRAERVRWGPLVYRIRDLGERRPATVRTVQWAAAAAVQIVQGHAVWGRRLWDAASHAKAREQIRATHLAGDREALAEALDRLENHKTQRSKRLVDMPKALYGATMLALGGLALLGLLMLALGVLIALTRPAGWTWGRYWHLYADIAHIVATTTVWTIQIGIFAIWPIWLIAAHRAGRTVERPGWLLAPAQRDDEAIIVTPAGISEALAHLGIAKLDQAMRGGWQVVFDTPPVRVADRGYEAVFALPLGVTPGMVADKGEVLARNLHRTRTEVWATEAKRAGYVHLWVANPGTSERPAPEYPLLHDGGADVFEGVPVGITQRGDELDIPIVGANWVAGGRMGQGKSNLCRVVVLGCATDPLCDLWVHVFAGNGDFDAYEPRLARYHRGGGDDVIYAGLQSLKDLYEEVARREERLKDLGAKKLTRGIARKHRDLRPIVALFSECHELFGSDLPAYEGAPKGHTVGKEATDYAAKTLRRARKTGLVLGFDTQSSRKDAIPPKIVELVGVNACFSVKTWRSNDGFLGDGSFQAGIRATELRFNVDRGTCLLTGASDEVFEVVKTYFIEVDDDSGWDAATDVIARTMAGRQPAVAYEPPAALAAGPDHLADIRDAMRGEVRVRTQVVLARLMEADPSTYEKWSAPTLASVLSDAKITIGKSHGGIKTIRLADVERALADRGPVPGGGDKSTSWSPQPYTPPELD